MYWCEIIQHKTLKLVIQHVEKYRIIRKGKTPFEI